MDFARRWPTMRAGWRCAPGLRAHSRPAPIELAEAGYVAPGWPQHWGLSADVEHQLIINQELSKLVSVVHTATQHMMVARPTWELAGRVLAGLETDISAL